ncbi:DUF1553 domain-containing protein [Roseiconus lacunae]|uniref:DUF1553 domain-containing protein n=1 Tax=Roseiconus lacunae TaxID=2605694 RepID=A0ABT7PKC0_9BACT|nr:DUF1553 domain-containing protein [Roseiconus lacunae]MDM4016948.1 DUF1553 domain-containing protein [Roseiconus lacunae]
MRIPSLQCILTALIAPALALVIALELAFSCGPIARAFEPGSVEFFEQKIRPVLAEHCYECHSEDADHVGGSLWLDSAEMMRDGGDSGPAIEPGDATASVLISALRYESSEMPPSGKLADDVIDDFVRWIDAGAIDPRTGNRPAPATSMSIDLDEGRKFWAFRPLEDTTQNESGRRDRRSISEMIDTEVRKQLDAAALVARPPAPPQQRLRRLAFDLTGLPPSDAIRQRWLDSPTDETWEAIVDELIDSRAFAQQWARHWMDVARYADSNGSDFNATYHDAWRYRNYLIDSFDQDRPLDQLIRQHVAGDLLPAESDGDRHDNLVATTFLMLGPKMLSERDKHKLVMDVVDDQIDTLGRAFLGLTLGCARCHDHKFDPIPMRDYYALAGIFKSTQSLNGESQQYVSDFNRVELPVSASHQQQLDDYQNSKTRLQRQLKEAKENLKKAESERTAGFLVDDVDAEKTGTWVESTYTKGFIGKGYSHDDNANKGDCSITFRRRLPKSGNYTVRFAYNTSGNRAANVPVTIDTADGQKQISVSQNKSLTGPPWKTLGTFRFDQNLDAIVRLTNHGTSGYVIADAVEFVPVDDTSNKDSQKTEQRIAIAKGDVRAIERQLKELDATKPPPIPVAMAPADRPTDQIGDCPLHIRGEVRNLGDIVPRGFLQVCSAGDATIESPHGSGRLELAHWLTDPDNPLVARVMVNRLWAKVFGEGIVRTVDNFGQRGERPSQPALLDALAIELMRSGWRAKPMIRQMVLSKTYSRSSEYHEPSAQTDPENRWLWRAHRKRIPAEAIRDSMLVAAGRLTDQEPTAPVADKGVLVTKNNASTKEVVSGIDQPIRTVYLPVIRSNIDPLLRSLDIADPDLLVGKRPVTNVPGQTLVLLNSEYVNAWAMQTADRIASDHDAWDDQIAAAYQVCLSREVTVADCDAIEHYLGGLAGSESFAEADSPDRQLRQLRDVVAALFASTEFRLLD